MVIQVAFVLSIDFVVYCFLFGSCSPSGLGSSDADSLVDSDEEPAFEAAFSAFFFCTSCSGSSTQQT